MLTAPIVSARRSIDRKFSPNNMVKENERLQIEAERQGDVDQIENYVLDKFENVAVEHVDSQTIEIIVN